MHITTNHLQRITDPMRLQTLAKNALLDSANKHNYDRFTALTANLLDTPVSLITLVDTDWLYLKSIHGLLEPWISGLKIPLSHSLCQYVVSSHQPYVIKDAREEPCLQTNVSVLNLGLIAYLGCPLEVQDQTLGALCVVDWKPRIWEERDIQIVQELAQCIAAAIELQIENLELQASEESFRALTNHAPIMIWQTDTKGLDTFFNTAWHTFTGLPEQECLDSTWDKVVHPDDRHKIREQWTQMLAQHLPFLGEYRLLRADGSYRKVKDNGSLYTHPETGKTSYIGIIVDVMEHQEVELQRDAFLHMITHELKNPLTSFQVAVQFSQRRIRHMLEQGQQSLTPEQQRALSQVMEYLTRGWENAQMQGRLINDLLDLSRADSGKFAIHLEPVDLISIVQETIRDQQAAAPQRTITLDIQGPTPIMILADAQRIRQVLINYVTNSLTYSYPGEPIQVGISSNADSARVWVKDCGIGLTKAQQAHIWERFYQAEEIKVPSGGNPGLGMGLYISRMLIQEHHGEVGVNSTKGKGCNFWFSLPRLTQDATTNPDETPS